MISALLPAQVATIRESFTEYECTGENTGILRCRRVIEIKDKRGEEMAYWMTEGAKNHVELKKFEGTITDGMGKVTKVKKSDLSYTEMSEAMTDESYHYYFSPRTASYPMTVVYQWEEVFASNIVYPMFAPITDYDVALDTASYRILTTPANTLRHKACNFEPQIREYDQKDKHVTEITLSHIAPFKHYSDGLPLDELIPIVYFAPTEFKYWKSHCDMSDWKSYGQWSYDLQQGRDVLPQPLLDQLKSMTDTCTSDRSKVGVVRRYMGSTTRYVNIVYGLGGYQPRSAEEVYKTGVGDCKALSNYFCSMLHALGIPAIYTLIGKKHLMHDMPTMQQLNHVIVQVPLPGDTLWVECTNPKYPYDFCPSGHRGHDVVLITPQGGVLSQIPMRVDAENLQTENFDVRVYASGDAEVRMVRTGQGENFESMLHLFDKRADELKEEVSSSIYLPHPAVQSVHVDRKGLTNILEMNATSVGWGRSSGSRLFLPITPHILANLQSAKSEPHTIDLEDAGDVLIDTIRFYLPKNVVAESVPATQRIESPFGSYDLQILKTDSAQAVSDSVPQILVVTRLDIHSGRYPADLYPDWVKFRQQIAALSKKQITVKVK